MVATDKDVIMLIHELLDDHIVEAVDDEELGSVGDDYYTNICSEGCAGVYHVEGTQGIVMHTQEGKYFHIFVKDITGVAKT